MPGLKPSSILSASVSPHLDPSEILSLGREREYGEGGHRAFILLPTSGICQFLSARLSARPRDFLT